MRTRIYGYLRVSSRDQNEARQLQALAPYDIPPRNLFLDKQSGKDFCRPAYQRLLSRLRRGDLVVVKSIDRLGRSYDDILVQWRHLTKEVGADVLVVDMPLLDTRMRDRDLTGTFIADLVLQILSYVAQTERENIRLRQAEGIAAARARGIHLGRHAKAMPADFVQQYIRWREGALHYRQLEEYCGASRATINRHARAMGLCGADTGCNE